MPVKEYKMPRRGRAGAEVPLGLRRLRTLRLGTIRLGRLRLGRLRLAGLARDVEGDRLAHEGLEGGLVDLFSLVEIDRAADVALEARVEETRRILQRRAFGEG